LVEFRIIYNKISDDLEEIVSLGITPRLGLSLTMASGKTCYLFGGVTNILTNKNESIPTHLNDLYSLDFSNEFLQWMIPEVHFH
jgi:hypothetical protein